MLVESPPGLEASSRGRYCCRGHARVPYVKTPARFRAVASASPAVPRRASRRSDVPARHTHALDEIVP